MQPILTSVASAAVISGDLIIGLSDGSIINCGRVQGPIGLTGDQGPMGATGRSGADGNTIHTVQGTPDTTLGKDGDFAINVKIWEIYGPRAGGAWGAGTPLRGNKRNGGSEQKDNIFGNNAPSGGGDDRPPIISPDGDITPPTIYPGAKPIKTGDFWVDGNGGLHVYYRGGWNKIRVYSDAVLAAGDAPAGSTREYNGGTGSAIAEAANGETFANQYEFNNWLYYRVDRAPVLADSEPAEHPDFPVTGLKPGDFWINSGDQLFTWKANQWVPLFAKGLLDVSDTPPLAPQKGQAWFDTEADELTLYIYTGSEWVPAAPPVSLDGVNATIDAALVVQNDLKTRVTEGESKQKTLQNKVAALEGTVIDGKWYAESRSTPRTGGFDITKGGVQSMSDWDADFIRVHKTDTTGKVFTFADVGVGDYLRIGAPGSTAVYRITDAPTGSLDWQAFGVELANSTGTPIPDLTYNFEFLPSFDPSAYATIQYVDVQDDLDVKKTGGTMTGDLKFDGGDRTITAVGGNRLRIGARDSSNNGRTFFDVQTADSSGTEGTDSGYWCKIYHLATPTAPLHGANKKYVDDQIAAIPAPTGGVPVGSIMIWMNSTAPDGWFKLQGGNFDVSTYPQLHAYLQSTSGYTSGKLPSWGGHYPGEYGDHLNQSLGSKQEAKTAQPSGGAPTSTSNTIPTGATRTFTATGNTNAYSNGQGRVAIGNGWDSTTRPKTVVVHYIIKHD